MKERLDVLLVRQGLAASREKAKAVIMAGNVLVNGQREDKAGTMIDEKAEITVKGKQLAYVSRGGLKLEKAMKHFSLTLEGKVCMGVGASTGGFTDCMLQNGAVRVFAIDVGHGQLDWKLRNDPRVVCMEKTNIRYVKPEDIGEKARLVSIDVSFISLQLVLPVVKTLIAEDCQVVCLIKPQFEAGREQVGKKGVVRDKAVHVEVIEKTITAAYALGFMLKELTFSPIKGPEGNIEYLAELMLRPDTATENDDMTVSDATVEKPDAAEHEENAAGGDDAADPKHWPTEGEESPAPAWLHACAVEVVKASHAMLDIK